MWNAVNGGLAASTMTAQHHTGSAIPHSPPPAHVLQHTVYPYAHPQHLKVLKLFVYIQYGCGAVNGGWQEPQP
jgi:hypothetical protein